MSTLVRTAAAAGVFALALITAACSTPGPVNGTFGPTSPKALLVVVHPNSSDLHTADFRRVNLSESRFERELVHTSAAGWLRNEINAESEVYMSVSEVAPGDYALVQLLAAPFATNIWSCMSTGSPVFPLRAGEITIVRVDSYWAESPYGEAVSSIPDDVIYRVFARDRAVYPDVVGEPSIGEPSAFLRWAEGGIGLTRKCSEPPTFTRIR